MNLGLTSWNPFTKILAAFGVIPTPLLTGYWGMMSSRSLIAAVNLGVFESLAAGPKTPEEVAEEVGLDLIGTEALLNALNGFGYVRRRSGRYANARAVKTWLESGARFPMTEAFGLFHVLWDELDDVEGRLRKGGARDFHRQDRDAEFWDRYQRALAAFAKLTSAEIVRRVSLDGSPGRLLDVGGGHGVYSAAFCRRFPALQAEIIDLPAAAEVGAAMIAEAGFSDRVSFRRGDLVGMDWGEGYDAVLMFNVVHTLTPAEVPQVFGQARAALRDGGTFVVLDSAHRGGSGDIDATGGANELMFWVINGTRAYPESDMVRWMSGAGFSDVRTAHLLSVPQSVLITGRTG